MQQTEDGEMARMTNQDQNNFSAMRIMLLNRQDKRVKVVCGSGSFICGRVKSSSWPYLTLSQVYAEHKGLRLCEGWAVIHYDDIKVLFPANEIENDEA